MYGKIFWVPTVGLSQYQKYVSDVHIDRKISIHHQNSLAIFKQQCLKGVSKRKQRVTSLKSDCNLFSNLYIASKYRDGNLEDFFAHENHARPPTLSDHGKLHLRMKKFDLH